MPRAASRRSQLPARRSNSVCSGVKPLKLAAMPHVPADDAAPALRHVPGQSVHDANACLHRVQVQLIWGRRSQHIRRSRSAPPASCGHRPRLHSETPPRQTSTQPHHSSMQGRSSHRSREVCMPSPATTARHAGCREQWCRWDARGSSSASCTASLRRPEPTGQLFWLLLAALLRSACFVQRCDWSYLAAS